MSIVSNDSKTQLYINIPGVAGIFKLSPVDLKTSKAFEDLKTAVGNLCEEINIKKPLKWVFTHTNPSNNITIRILPRNIQKLKNKDEINLHFPEETVDDIVRAIQENERSYELYESFSEDMKAEFRVCSALLNKNPQMYEKLPLEMQRNETLCMNLVMQDPSMFEKLLPEMQKNQEVCIRLIMQDSSMFEKLPPEMQKNQDVCMCIVNRNPLMYEKLPSEMQKDENLCINLIKQDPSMFKELSTTMQNTSSVRETFQLYSKQEGLWEARSVKQDEESQGYIYTFALASKYNYENCLPLERNANFKRSEKQDDMFPAIQMKPSYAVQMINNPQLEILLKLGFSANLTGSHLTLSIPDQRTVENRWNQLRKTDSSYPELKFQECNGIASDQKFIEKLVITEPVDAIISTDKEFIHDMTIHVFNTICKCIDSKANFLSDMQQFREVCKYYYDKIQKFEALQKTKNNSLNLTYSNYSLSASYVAKLAYFSLAAYIDAVTSLFDRQEFQKNISNIKSYIVGNGNLIDFLISRHRQGQFVDIELDAFKLIWEHIDKHTSPKVN